jgi:sporulation protein YlmC with PRC-barrel domain
MRASELLNVPVIDETGATVGRVRDLRVARRGLTLRIAGLAVGGGRLANAWGYADERATGPWLLRALNVRGARATRFVPAGRILQWGPGVVRIRGRGDNLPPLLDEVRS